jgi:hypothetical protein
VWHRRNRIRLRVNQQGARGSEYRRGGAGEDLAPQCRSDDVAARQGRAARNSRHVIRARALKEDRSRISTDLKDFLPRFLERLGARSCNHTFVACKTRPH